MKTESPVQQRVQLHQARLGHHAWRNNVGACEDAHGRHVRYGLANLSKQQNEQIKSSDLIGITTVVITPDMVGKRVGVFTAHEIKRPGWHLTPGNKRGQAQLRYINIVREAAGFAGFVTGIPDISRIMTEHEIYNGSR